MKKIIIVFALVIALMPQMVWADTTKEVTDEPVQVEEPAQEPVEEISEAPAEDVSEEPVVSEEDEENSEEVSEEAEEAVVSENSEEAENTVEPEPASEEKPPEEEALASKFSVVVDRLKAGRSDVSDLKIKSEEEENLADYLSFFFSDKINIFEEGGYISEVTLGSSDENPNNKGSVNKNVPEEKTEETFEDTPETENEAFIEPAEEFEGFKADALACPAPEGASIESIMGIAALVTLLVKMMI